MLAVASIGPCKWFAAFGITSKVSPRRGESTHLRPKSRLTAVGLRNAPAGAAPYNPLLLFITNNSDYLQKARKYGHFTGYKN